MPTTKKLATWLWTQLKSEMRFQKAPSVQRQPQYVQYVVQPAKSTKGTDALRGVLLIIIAPIIFVILALMIGF